MAAIAYVTDVEGQWHRFARFLEHNPYVRLDRSGALRVADGAVLVYGGDAIDRGDDGRRVVATLLAAKRRQPAQVVILCGNRDLNKLRLVHELADPAQGASDGAQAPRAEQLRKILAETMGAPRAFDHRAAELDAEHRASDPEAVVASFLDDLAPDGELTAYLAAGQLAYRAGETLFVHGAVTQDAYGHVPGRAHRIDDTDEWLAELDRFYRDQMTAFRSRSRGPDGRPGWDLLMHYQGPLPGTRFHQASVVYGRPIDDDCNPVFPAPEVIAALQRDGVARIVVGHTSSGDCPGVVRDDAGFELILADHSHGAVPAGSQVLFDDSPRILGATRLPDGSVADVVTRLSEQGPESPLGTRQPSGYFVKGRLARGDYLLYRCSAGYKVQHATALAEDLVPARRPRSAARNKEYRMADLNLWKKQLGSVPDDVWERTDLETLVLADNGLTELSPAIGRLRRLRMLDLGHNRLTALPETLGDLEGLIDFLYLHDNKLSALPRAIARLTRLRYLNISDNLFTSLPDELCAMTGLVELRALDNQLSALPPAIAGLGKLRELHLRNNLLVTLPDAIGRLPALRQLDLRGNPLVSLPDSIAALPALEKLDLRWTTFPLPAWCADLEARGVLVYR